MSKRIEPVKPPYKGMIKSTLAKLTPKGKAPLVLFTTLARDERLFGKLMAGSLLDEGHLTLRQREIVIDRVTARCGSEYEWGVHVAYFAADAGLSDAELYALVHGTHKDTCWTDPSEQLLIQMCDALHDECDINDRLWKGLAASFTLDALLEIIMLCGFYRTISYLTNSARLGLEPAAARFPAIQNAV